MSKSNVNPNHYKVAGRERQGEDIAQAWNKQKHAESLVRRRAEVGARVQTPAPQLGAASPDAAPTRAAKTATHKARATPLQATQKARVKLRGADKRSKRSGAQKRATSRDDVGTLPGTEAVVRAFGKGLPRRRPQSRT